MAWIAAAGGGAGQADAALRVDDLNVYYGRAHALQSVSLELAHGVLAVVGRNGMGKTTLCNAITGLVPASGSIRFGGEEILGLAPNVITRRGIGYVPQGRRVWPSLTVDEHLRLAAGVRRRGRVDQERWTVKRVYEAFPRLAERRENGGAQLSGGEQQMLAIARALLLGPRLLVMDEPTEGLAPVIVEQVKAMLKSLVQAGDMSVLLIEQNLGVALDIADTVAVLVNGRIARIMPAAALAADVGLQQRLLGIGRGVHEEEATGLRARAEDGAHGRAAPAAGAADAATPEPAEPVAARIFTIKRNFDDPGSPLPSRDEARAVRNLTRWNSGDPAARPGDRPLQPLRLAPADRLAAARADGGGELPSAAAASAAVRRIGQDAKVLEFPVSGSMQRAAYIAGTFDTKARELMFLRSCLEKLGLRTVTVDLSTSGGPSPAMIHPREVARHHPQGERAVFTGDRGSAVAEMATAFARFLPQRRDVGGIISAGGSGGTALATAAMRELPIGLPKVMVSTVASGDIKPYVGPSDICMMYSVTDVSGINRISAQVLSNAAHALAGMIAWSTTSRIGRLSAEAGEGKAGEPLAADGFAAGTKPAIGLTMFGVTTPCVQAVSRRLEDSYDCLVFHATGTGGQSMEKLVDSRLLSAVIDVSTTEIADEIVGGRLSAGPQRLDAIIRTRVPYVGSVGALDMVNFWAPETVPAQFKTRNLYRHNQNVTLMRTTPGENALIGQFIVKKLNRMEGPVRFLLPEKGVSMLDAPGKPFHDEAADKALFDAIAGGFRATTQRRLVRLPFHINDPEFADALVAAFHEVAGTSARRVAGRG